MKIFSKSIAFLTTVCMLSATHLTSTSAYADICCDQSVDNCGCLSPWWILLGSAALGAAAGAGTGAAVSSGNHGKKGDRGPMGLIGHTGATGVTGIPGAIGATGATGATGTPLIDDSGTTLTFDYTLTLTSGAVGAVVTPFVVKPDQTVVTNGSTTLSTGLSFVLPSIVISPVDNDPVEFGDYDYGVNVDAVVTVTGGVAVEVVASSPRNETIILPTLALDIALDNTEQAAGSFAYGPVGTVP